MPGFTPTSSGLPPRHGDFPTLLQALDYAARGESGFDFYSVRGELAAALPYRRLRERAVGLAHRLAARDLGPGGRVAVVASTGPEFVEAFFACQYAGLVPAPLPMPQAFGGRAGYVAHVRRLMTGARAKALLAPAELVDWLRPLAVELGLSLCCTVAELGEDEDLVRSLPTVRPGDVAYLQFSSGSTRFPVGVAVLHQALMANIAGILGHGLQVRPGDRAVSWLPFYHDMGLVGFLLSPLAGQISVDFLATADFARRPMLWLSMISRARATISYSPSFGYDLCTRRGGRLAAGLDLSCWRIAGIGGDMIRPAVLAGFAEAFGACGFDRRAFLPSYGMAEATLAISFAPVGRGIETDTIDLDRLEQEDVAVPPRDPHGRSRSVVLCGRALPGHEIRICGPGDPDGSPGGPAGVADGLPERRVGRVLVRGPSLMRGYDGRPDDTAAVLSADGWLDTGDLGYLLDGTLVITGRAKDLIIINGRNIWPQDLEWTIEQSLPAIRTGNVAAFSVDEDGQEVLILAAEASAPADGTASSTLTAAIADTVRAQHGIDGRVVLLLPGTLPYTSSGKLSRSAARQRYLAGSLAAVPA